MPIGFFDKYFNEDEDDYLVLLHNARNKDDISETIKPVNAIEKEEEKLVLVKDQSKIDADKQEADMKSRILQAAQQYMVITYKLTEFHFINIFIIRMKKKKILTKNMLLQKFS